MMHKYIDKWVCPSKTKIFIRIAIEVRNLNYKTTCNSNKCLVTNVSYLIYNSNKYCVCRTYPLINILASAHHGDEPPKYWWCTVKHKSSEHCFVSVQHRTLCMETDLSFAVAGHMNCPS